MFFNKGKNMSLIIYEKSKPTIDLLITKINVHRNRLYEYTINNLEKEEGTIEEKRYKISAKVQNYTAKWATFLEEKMPVLYGQFINFMTE